jgi:peptidoglycan-N-acetylglucosamine deacetylase
LSAASGFFMGTTKQFLITVDVEDWFQVENLKGCIPFSSWDSFPMRVEKNTHALLDLLDSASGPLRLSSDPPTTSGLLPNLPEHGRSRATFFVLGWIAKRVPNLVREIHSRGHEVASHGQNHILHHDCSSGQILKELSDSRKLLEDIVGHRIYGYRAPSFSINDDILKLIQDSGYCYDSSFNSFRGNTRYGTIDLMHKEKVGMAYRFPGPFYELPISNLPAGNQWLPVGGGGYFRIIPAQLLLWCIQRLLKKDSGYLFYIHPWEIDPGQPRLRGTSFLSHYRHYVNLHKALPKLSFLMDRFQDCRFVSCRQYIEGLSR